MKRVWRTLAAFFLLLTVTALLVPSQTLAATVKSGDQVILPETETNLEDLYLFGGTIQLDAPVTNDLVFGGGTVTINGDVTGDLMGGGGTVITKGTVGDTVRIGGGTVTIDGPVTNDLLISGGTVTVTKNASIGGDLLFAGGQLQLEGPVAGNVMLGGGQAAINSKVNGNVNGEVGQLTLGPEALIAGNLSYRSPEKAQIAQGGRVEGRTDYTVSEDHKEDKKDDIAGVISAGFYKVIVDIIVSLLLIYLFRRGIQAVINSMRTTPAKNGAYGFALVVLVPFAALLLMLVFWLGLGLLLTYALALLVSVFLAKIFLGWMVLAWWDKRHKKHYALDWKAGVVGPLLVFVLLLIPFFGWLAVAVLVFIAVGALFSELLQLIKQQPVVKKK